MKNKSDAYLCMAMAAGRLKSGEFQCEACIKGGKAFLLVIANDASHGTKKKFHAMSEFYRVPFVESGCKEELGRLIGKTERSVVCFTDEGLAKAFINAI